MKYRQLYGEKELAAGGSTEYTNVEMADGSSRVLTDDELSGAVGIPEGGVVYSTASVVSDGFRQNTSVPFEWKGFTFKISSDKNWKTSLEGMIRLCNAGRIEVRDGHRIFRRCLLRSPCRSGRARPAGSNRR